MKQHLLAIALSCCGVSTLTHADDLESQKNIAKMNQQQIAVEGGLTVTVQHADTSGVDNELFGSFDLVSILPAGEGEVVIYVEGNTNPLADGVASHFEEANGDAGSARDRDGKGRFQVSEFFYTRDFGAKNVIVGLLDPAASLDSSEVANDETAQFLGTSFVNNPTIGMPDYTLGAVYRVESTRSRPGFVFMATSSHGLADNPDAAYSELVDVSADGKGAFLAVQAEGAWGIASWNLGVWSNSADHDYLDGSDKTGTNTGVYLGADLDLEPFLQHSKLNVRLGMADEKVSSAAKFYALALEAPVVGDILGVGLSQTSVSSKVGGSAADMRQAEIYVRFDVSDALHVTPSLQWIENSGLVKNEGDKSTLVTSLRASYAF